MPRQRTCRWWAPAGGLMMAAAVPLALVLGLGGCAQPAPPEPRMDHNTLDDDAFLGYLADQPLVTVDEAYRAMVILAEGEDANQDFEQRRAWLERGDIARAAWNLRPGDYVDNGSISFMVCKILQIKGGLNRIMLGSWGLGDRRYAYRELVHRELISTPSADYAPMTGGELVDLLGLADEYMADRGIYQAEPVELELPG